MRSSRAAALALCFALVAALGACGGGSGDGSDEGGRADEATADGVDLPAVYSGYESEMYAASDNWLCKPGLDDDDVCSRDLDATVVHADGTVEIERHQAAEDPPVDCFYVYPTVSYDTTPNSDLDVGENEEIGAVYNQVARLTGACRVFAPVYRQLTLGMIGGAAPEGADPWATAYADVVDAFRHYVANESEGRGFVLVGHSQGANHLRRLIAEEIDDEPLLRDRLVSALLLGWAVAVPEGEVVGGDFDNVPLCERTDQVSCVVSYSSFRSTAPPPPSSFFGRPMAGGGRSACVNPASPGGGAAFLSPYFPVAPAVGSLIGGAAAQPFADATRAAEITTPFVTYPDFVEGECVDDGEFTYLSLTVDADPSDPRADDIGGDLSPEWGMHLVDANVAMGDLLDLVTAQAAAYDR